MSAYASEWPLLVLSPSSARFNWEAECLKWLGKNDEDTSNPRANHDALVEKDDIQVLENGKEKIHLDADCGVLLRPPCHYDYQETHYS